MPLGVQHPQSPVSSGRGKTIELWSRCMEELILRDRNAGYLFEEQFWPEKVDLAAKTVVSSSGTADHADMDGGGLSLDAGASTAGQGIIYRSGGYLDEAGNELVAEEFEIDANSEHFFEARLKLSTIGSDPRFFIGLGDSAATSGASDVSATNAIGLTNSNGSAYGSALYGYSESGGTAARTSSSLLALTAGEFMKVGFRVYGDEYIEFYVNGERQLSYRLTSVPTTEMTFVCAPLAGGSQVVTVLDWFRFGKQFRK